MQKIYIQTSRSRLEKWEGFIYKVVVSASKGEKHLNTNYSCNFRKVERISIQTSRLRFKRCKGFTYKLVVQDSKDAKDLYTN